MALFDEGSPTTLEDVLGRQADTAAMDIQNQFVKKRQKTIASQATGGRLRSGVSNYQFGDLAADELGQISGVQSSLADALAQVPLDDYANQQDDARKLELAKLIGEMNQSGGGALGGALGGLTGALTGAATGFKVGGPWGAIGGGALGGALGSYGGLNKRRTY